MNVYVASSTRNLEQVHAVQQWVREEGHTITHDWAATIPAGHQGGDDGLTHQQAQTAAERDLRGVRRADLIIALYHPALFGGLIEVGAAIAHGWPVWLTAAGVWSVDDWRESVFFHLSNVHRVEITDVRRLLAEFGEPVEVPV